MAPPPPNWIRISWAGMEAMEARDLSQMPQGGGDVGGYSDPISKGTYTKQ